MSPDALPLLRAKHVRGLENLLGALQASLRRFETLQAEFAEINADIQQRHGAAADTAPSNAAAVAVDSARSKGSRDEPAIWGVVGAGRGLDAQRVGLPPTSLLFEWVREFEVQFAAELLLKLELVDGISLGMSADALHGVHRLWTLQPHLNTVMLERTAALNESLTLPPATV